MTHDAPLDAMFSGVIGQEYDFLKLICPAATEMSRLVGVQLGIIAQAQTHALRVLELGSGTGITTLSILNAAADVQVLSVDNEPNMLRQAQAHLKTWQDAGRLSFAAADALSALQAQADASVDVVASAYTLHNFETGYRQQVLREIFRVLKPGGWLVNGDRYALDDVDQHTRAIQNEVAGYFKVLTALQRLDVLEHWIIHLFSDESENHLMRQQQARQHLLEIGFVQLEFSSRIEVNALLTAVKPY